MSNENELLNRAATIANRFLGSLGDRSLRPSASIETLRDSFDVPLTDDGESGLDVLDAVAASAEGGLSGSAGPRYFGFVIGGSLPIALATDWLVSTWDQNAGIYVTSPASSVVEEVAARWLLEVLALPRSASVGFVTGCQMASFTALAAARHGVLRRADWNVEELGLAGAPRVHIIVGAEAHITIHSALRLLGFGTKTLIATATDEEGRMIPSAVAETLRSLEGPVILCCQVGNVNTGAIDPVGELAAIAHERRAWLHVDGAFGLWAAASPRLRELVRGVELADSWATDAHKWLNVPYDSGIAIVADSAAHRASMTLSAAYLEQTAGAERDAIDWVPEFSRRARGFPIYAALRFLGRRGLGELIDRCCSHAERFARLLAADSRVRILSEVVLNQVLVRFEIEGQDPDELTRSVIRRVQQEGTCWLAGTTWHGMAAMRISVSNWSTTEADVDASAAAILRCIQEE
jgi:glutamate/tyrosine decarboxylase-like PLP-dependent enzyme